MSWVSDYQYKWHEALAMKVVRAGGCIPHHIAFVMDGNRRYAKSEHLRKIEGHTHGFNKLSDCLRWCLDIGIREVTTFAFSIENFKRSEEEVNDLLNLAREKFQVLLSDLDTFHKHGVRIRAIGNMSLLPEDLQKLIAKAMLETENNDKLFLNMAFSYTSRDEITQAVEVVLTKGDDVLDTEDINERLLEECLYTRHSSPPDLLFRTSGETRISDFLMWQLTTTVLYFSKVMWPQITIWNFLSGIFAYQRVSLRMEPYRKSQWHQRIQLAKNSNFYTYRIQGFLQALDTFRRSLLLKMEAFTS